MAARSKNTYLSAQFKRISVRRGAKRAALAVAHTILVTMYHMLARGLATVSLVALILTKRMCNESFTGLSTDWKTSASRSLSSLLE